jgi:hypothetical protein
MYQMLLLDKRSAIMPGFFFQWKMTGDSGGAKDALEMMKEESRGEERPVVHLHRRREGDGESTHGSE